jgi:hypothetical protein
MVIARLAHVIRYITPPASRSSTARRQTTKVVSGEEQSIAVSAVAMTECKHKPSSGDVTAIRSGAVTLAGAADAFLSSPRAASPNTRRAYSGVIDRLVVELGPDRPLAAVPGDEIAAAVQRRPQPPGSSPVMIMRLIDRSRTPPAGVVFSQEAGVRMPCPQLRHAVGGYRYRPGP